MRPSIGHSACPERVEGRTLRYGFEPRDRFTRVAVRDDKPGWIPGLRFRRRFFGTMT